MRPFNLRNCRLKPDKARWAKVRAAKTAALRVTAFAVIVWTMPAAQAQSRIEEIPREWKPTNLRALLAPRALASSTLGGAEGPYMAGRVVDGDRGTKWVAEERATLSSPQWITLDLAGPQVLVGLAVFGEAPGNDGVIDAQIQVAGAKQDDFSTVASVKDAKSRSWLATFPPVETSKVRLLVTRSGGVSTHTDVYEIVPLGRPLSAVELKAEVRQQLGQCSREMQTFAPLAPPAQGRERDLRETLVREITPLRRQFEGLEARFNGWDALDESQRLVLAEQSQRMASVLPALAGSVSNVWTQRLQDISRLESAGQACAKNDGSVTSREGSKVRIQNRDLVISLDQSTGTWDVTWLATAEPVVWGIGCVLKADGREFRPEGVNAEVKPFADKLGRGHEILQSWGERVRVERVLRVHDDGAYVVVSGRIINQTDGDITLDIARLVDVSTGRNGWWYAGRFLQAPGAVFISGLSELSSQPVTASREGQDTGRKFSATGVLAIAHDESSPALAIGYLTALEARPDVNAEFKSVQAGTALSAQQPFLGRKLARGASLQLDSVCLIAETNIYQTLENYADLVAALSRSPIRKGPNSLWCSWYAHRMSMTEDLVLANAAVAARHFKPLGLEIMQLDHGWQRGDITGDWVANERFPHGLKWLSDQLQARYGLKLGVWIAPTDVAQPSQTFREHPDWMLRNAEGKPMVNWRWYWKPNPDCFELDSSHPEAARFIRDTFARLSSEGVSYYMIDFLAAAGGEHFWQRDPYCTRGWGVLRRAMEAIREGAGEQAWIRYSQLPPLLSVGLANSAFGGDDTLDAGLGGKIEVLRRNTRFLAAGYWINDRLYHREVCDMSVRMQAPLEEVRLRLAMMTLAGCSISFSDEFQYLPPSRIRLMQTCLPPGAPPMKPLDLLARPIPSVWHIPCRTKADEWEVIGLFNLESQPEDRVVELSSLGYPPGTKAIGFEFWEQRLIGVVQDRLQLRLPPQSSRIIFLRRLAGRPQFLGTDLQMLGGFHELKEMLWDESRQTLSGRFQRAPALSGRAFFYLPAGYQPRFDFPLNETSARLTNIGDGLWAKEIEFQGSELEWSIPFQRAPGAVMPKAEPNQAQ